MYVCTWKREGGTWEGIKERKSQFVLMSAVIFLSVNESTCTRMTVVPRTNKQNITNMMETLMFTHHFSSPPLCVSLSFCLFQKKSSCSWPTFLKKKKKIHTFKLEIASSLHSWHVRKRVIFPHWWFDWRKTTGSWTSRAGGLTERQQEEEKKKHRERMIQREERMSNVTGFF